ncbi:MAG TPA: C4-type zinc ribbon domain-containing protein [Actinomycetota bacterium]|nr:C4-type zinc ribbon domain-containing protein [Actinomycetota bacterium]
MAANDPQEADLLRLLDLQREDSEIRRLTERKASLPEAARLAELNERLEELGADLAIARKQQDEVEREQTRLEGEGDLLDAKIGREEQRLFSGAVGTPKELSSLQAEVDMLKRKKASLEDDLLEVMVQKDSAATTTERLQAEHEELEREATSLAAVVNELTAEIDARLVEHSGARTRIAAAVSEDLLTLYERIREQKHGVGAAALENGTCSGCHTKLPAREVERLKVERGLQRCDNCRRILVVA